MKKQRSLKVKELNYSKRNYMRMPEQSHGMVYMQYIT